MEIFTANEFLIKKKQHVVKTNYLWLTLKMKLGKIGDLHSPIIFNSVLLTGTKPVLYFKQLLSACCFVSTFIQWQIHVCLGFQLLQNLIRTTLLFLRYNMVRYVCNALCAVSAELLFSKSIFVVCKYRLR